MFFESHDRAIVMAKNFNGYSIILFVGLKQHRSLKDSGVDGPPPTRAKDFCDDFGYIKKLLINLLLNSVAVCLF